MIALAQRGVYAEGYEINPILVLLSRRAIRKAGVQDKAKVYWEKFLARRPVALWRRSSVYGIPIHHERSPEKIGAVSSGQGRR